MAVGMNGVSYPQQQIIREMFYRHAALRTRLTAVCLHSPVASTGIHRRWQSRHKVLRGSGSGSTLPVATTGIHRRYQTDTKFWEVLVLVPHCQWQLQASTEDGKADTKCQDILLVLVPHRRWQQHTSTEGGKPTQSSWRLWYWFHTASGN